MPNTLKTLWNGDFPLSQAFWHYAIAYGTIANILAQAAATTADDLATWMRALVGGNVFNADFQRQWLASPEATEPGKPAMQKYGYGILTITFGPNVIYYLSRKVLFGPVSKASRAVG